MKLSHMHLASCMLALTIGTGLAYAQTATDKDKQYLKNTAEDSNYEIETGQLALQKSSSADVKQYATMVIHDHTMLKQQVKAADAAAGVSPTDSNSMSLSDHARYDELKLLKGDSFDKSYIKGLVKGNKQSVNDGKSEASSTIVPAIKRLAEHQVALDNKHTEKADQLAQAHGVSAGQ